MVTVAAAAADAADVGVEGRGGGVWDGGECKVGGGAVVAAGCSLRSAENAAAASLSQPVSCARTGADKNRPRQGVALRQAAFV